MSLLSAHLAQASLAAAFLISLAASYAALSPPNPNPSRTANDAATASGPPQPSQSLETSAADAKPAVTDSLSSLKMTSKRTNDVALAPMAFLALQSAGLAYTYPEMPATLLRQAFSNDGLNVDLITWSPATAIPMVLLLGAGVPLRLAAYRALGRQFTFALAPPTALTTSGLYRWVQHPSYTGLAITSIANVALYYRPDGALACWVPKAWYPLFRAVWWPAVAVGVAGLLAAIRVRVQQEERMLRDQFGAEWEEWHAKTPRFVPFLL